jgi:tetratricopeptide (TPR) repeat protein
VDITKNNEDVENSFEYFCKKGQYFYEHNKFKEAIAQYKKAKNLLDDKKEVPEELLIVDMCLKMGEAYRYLKEYVKAHNILDKAIKKGSRLVKHKLY